MSNTLRQLLLLAALGAILLGLAAKSWLDLHAKRRAADAAIADLNDVQHLAQRITAMRDRPAVAGSQEIEIGELSQQIEQAAKDAQIPSPALVRIWPEPAQRVGESPYKQKPIQVLLRGVDLRQVINFLHSNESATHPLSTRSLRLSVPNRSGDDDGLWTAEITLCYLLYQPPAAATTNNRSAASTTPRTTFSSSARP